MKKEFSTKHREELSFFSCSRRLTLNREAESRREFQGRTANREVRRSSDRLALLLSFEGYHLRSMSLPLTIQANLPSCPRAEPGLSIRCHLKISTIDHRI